MHSISSLIEQFRSDTYEQKKEKVLSILERFVANQSVASYYHRISANDTIEEVVLERIYVGFLRKGEQKIAAHIQAREKKQKQSQRRSALHDAVMTQEQQDAEMLLDCFL